MNRRLLLIIALGAGPLTGQAQLYELIDDLPGGATILLEQGKYKRNSISCESEAISKGTYRLDKDTLKLFPYSSSDSILPLPDFQFTPGNDDNITIKVVDEAGRPWRGFNVTTGNTKDLFYELYTDSNGICTYKDTSHRFLILSYLNSSLNFSDEDNLRYFWDSKRKGTYLVSIPDNGFYVLDRNVIIADEPVSYLKKGEYLYHPDDLSRPIYKRKRRINIRFKEKFKPFSVLRSFYVPQQRFH